MRQYFTGNIERGHVAALFRLLTQSEQLAQARRGDVYFGVVLFGRFEPVFERTCPTLQRECGAGVRRKELIESEEIECQALFAVHDHIVRAAIRIADDYFDDRRIAGEEAVRNLAERKRADVFV